MNLSVEDLFKARDFVDIKNINAQRIELAFKNPVVAMLAKSKIKEIASQCGPDKPFHSCEQKGNDVFITYNPEIVNERLLAEIFTGSTERAQQASKELSDYIAERMKA